MPVVTIKVDRMGRKLRILSEIHILRSALVVLSHLASKGKINAKNTRKRTEIIISAGNKEAPTELPLVKAQ